MLDFAPGPILSGGSLSSATRVASGLSLIRDLELGTKGAASNSLASPIPRAAAALEGPNSWRGQRAKRNVHCREGEVALTVCGRAKLARETRSQSWLAGESCSAFGRRPARQWLGARPLP